MCDEDAPDAECSSDEEMEEEGESEPECHDSDDSAEEDQVLRALHAQHLDGHLSLAELWTATREQLPARTPGSISGRFVRLGLQYLPAPCTEKVVRACKLSWTEEEISALRALHAQHQAGRLSRAEFWAAVASEVPSRTQVAVNKRLNMNGLCQVGTVDTGAHDGGEESDVGGSELSDGDPGADCEPAGAHGRTPGRMLWTAEEDRALRALHAKHAAGSMSSADFWAATAAQLPSRTSGSVTGRLHRCALQVPHGRPDRGALDGEDRGESDDDDGGKCAPAGRVYWTAAENKHLRALHAQFEAGRLSRAQFWAEVKDKMPTRNGTSVRARLGRMGLSQIAEGQGRVGAKAPTTTAQHAFFTEEEDAQLLAEATSGRHFSMAAVAAAVVAKSSRSVTSLLARLKRLKRLGLWPGFELAEPPQHAAEDAAAPSLMLQPLPDYADLPPPPLWMLRVPSTGKVAGPYLLSSLRRGVRDGDITALEARLARAWQVGQNDAEAMSLQQALELPKLRSRNRQLERLRRQQQRAARPGLR